MLFFKSSFYLKYQEIKRISCKQNHPAIRKLGKMNAMNRFIPIYHKN